MLSIRFHLPVMIVCEFLGFFAGAIAVGAMWISGQFGDRLWLAGIAFCCAGVVGTVIPRFVFRVLIPARCRQERCGGHAYPTGSDPITYVCRRCGQATATHVSDDDGRDTWNER